MLKPGGRLLISDYCRSSAEPSSSFAAYISQRGYYLHPVEDYGRILKEAGFYDVKAEDRTWQVLRCLTVTYTYHISKNQLWIKLKMVSITRFLIQRCASCFCLSFKGTVIADFTVNGLVELTFHTGCDRPEPSNIVSF